jgi:hypothetical protein
MGVDHPNPCFGDMTAICLILICLASLAWALVFLALIGLVYRGWPKRADRRDRDPAT